MLGNANVDRTSRRREATRLEILEAAWAVVRDSGWSGLTQRALAERVGMRAPSLYGHFASKLSIVDGMFGQAWAEFDAEMAQAQRSLPHDPRQALHAAGLRVFDAMAADQDRYALMNQRPVPGFVPGPDSYAHAVAALERLHGFLSTLGVRDPDAADLFTALVAGLVGQQIANDPGGDRWRRLLPRALDMFADEVGIDPRTPGGKPSSQPRSQSGSQSGRQRR
jgi:AcrR family transcriptional regulator